MAISQNFTDTEGFLWDFQSAAPNTGVGLNVVDGTNDAFDNAFQLVVDGSAINPQTASVDFGGRELNTAPFLSGNIAVSRSVLVSDASISPVGFARFLDSFTNTGTTTQTITVQLIDNPGSDAATAVQSTTSGDTVLSAADFGFASDDGNLSGGDSSLGFAYGDGVGLLPSAAGISGSGTGLTFGETYTITLAPGETRRILHYAVQNTTAAASVADYTTFTRNLDLLRSENLLAGLSETEVSQVVNYSYGSGPLPPVVLTDGDGNRWGLDQNEFGLRSLDTDALLHADGGDVVQQNFTDNRTVTLSEDGQEATYRATFAGFPGVAASYSVMASPTRGYVRALLRIDSATPLSMDGLVGTGLDAKFAGTQSLIADRPLAGGAGDGTVTLADGGVVVDDSASGAGGTRPALTAVFGDTAAIDADPDGEANTLTGNRLTATDTSIVVDADTSQSFLYFFALNDDGLGGLADLNALSTPGYEALAGLSASDVASIKNFTLSDVDRLQTTAGGGDANTLIGHFWGDFLLGQDGDDHLFGFGSDDLLNGGNGNDTLDGGIGDDILNGGADSDTADWSAATSVLVVTLDPGGNGSVTAAGIGTDTFTSIENVVGGAAGDTITGNDAANVIDGQGGADQMRGGKGDDTYIVDVGDIVTEAVGGGTDTVATSVSYTLAAGQEIEKLTTRTAAAATAINLTGNEFAQQITGNAGNNVIDGRGGADTMAGGAGNDTYIVDIAADRVSEAAGGGTDRVVTSVSYTLTAGQSIETFTPVSFGGTSAIGLTGNALAQAITGNAGDNAISDGGAGGADSLSGLAGNDTYVVNNTGDAVAEAASAGTDRVAASVSYTLGAGQSIETLTPVSFGTTTNINLTGNALAQAITGNAGNNTINDGGAGAGDTMSGLGGNDIYLVNNTGDAVTEAASAGTDRVAASVSYTLGAGQSIETLAPTSFATTTSLTFNGNALAQAILGNAGDNVIDGKGGNDTLTGMGGNDTFRFDTAPNTATNDPTITDFSVGADMIELSHAIFAAVPIGSLSPGAFFIGSAAQDATDRIVYNSGTGALLYDADGNGGGASVQFAKLSSGLTTLSASQFQVTA